MKNEKVLTAAELVELKKKMETTELTLENCILRINPADGSCGVFSNDAPDFPAATITLAEGARVAKFFKDRYPEVKGGPKKPKAPKKPKPPRAALGKGVAVEEGDGGTVDDVG